MLKKAGNQGGEGAIFLCVARTPLANTAHYCLDALNIWGGF